MGQCLGKPGNVSDGVVPVGVTGVESLKEPSHARSRQPDGNSTPKKQQVLAEPGRATPDGSSSALILAEGTAHAKPVSLSSAMFVGAARRSPSPSPRQPQTPPKQHAAPHASPRNAEPSQTQPPSQPPPQQQRKIRKVESRLNRSTNAHNPSNPSIYYNIRRKEYVDDYYIIEEKLGHGQFGEVFAGTHKVTGKRYAIKSMSKSKAEADPEFLKDVRREVEIMHQLGKHPNIVCLHEVFEDPGAIHLIMELCEGGNWFQRLIEHGTYSEIQAAETIRTLLKTLAYCHSVGVVHRDIKPENILLSDDTEDAALKLADFGLSAIVPAYFSEDPGSHYSPGLLTDAVGTSYYVAPEVLKNKGYDSRCDIWSLGVVLYIVLGGMAPFDGANEEQILESVMHGRLSFKDPTWDEVSSSAKDMIKRMLCRDPRKRASIAELLAHPWLKLADLHVTAKAEPVAKSMPEKVVERLQAFAAMNRFKKEARRMLAVFLPEEDIIALLEEFKSLDRDGDGVLTLAELHEAMNAKGTYLPKEDAQDLLDCVDLNSNGVIDYEEFLAATVHQMHLEKQELLYRAFQNFDHERTGLISVQELREAFIGQGASVDAEIVLRNMGHVGMIDYATFCTLMQKLEQGSAKRSGVSSARLLLSLSSRVRADQLRGSRGTPAKPGHSNRSHFMSLLGSLASSHVTDAPSGKGMLSSTKSARTEPSDGALSGIAQRTGSQPMCMPSNSSSAATHSSFYKGAPPSSSLHVQSPQRRHVEASGARRSSTAAAAAAAIQAVSPDSSAEPLTSPKGASGATTRVLMRDASLRDKPMPGMRRGPDSEFAPASACAHPNSTHAPSDLPSALTSAPSLEAPSAPPVRLSPLSSNYRTMLRQFSTAQPQPRGFSRVLSTAPEVPEGPSDEVALSGNSESSLVIQKNEASLDQWGLTKQLGEDRALNMSETAAHPKSRFFTQVH